VVMYIYVEYVVNVCMSMGCVDPKYTEIVASVWSNQNKLKLCILYSHFGGHFGTRRHLDFSCKYSYSITFIDLVDVLLLF
jgi:hypothetical protein